MIIPIGHERGSVRRLPWVTFGIMGVCVLSLLASFYAPSHEEEAAALARKISAFFIDHPHLGVDEDVEKLLFAGMDQDERQGFVELWRETRPPETDANARADLQAEFDGLVAELRALGELHPLRRWGWIPARASAWTLFTHMFMHAGVLHLLGNLLILYLAGPFVEDVWGRGVYAGFYVAAGLTAAVVFSVTHPDLNLPLVGASGAIAGVMGAFLVRYRKTHIHFFYIVGFMMSGTFSAPAWVMLPMWFVEQLFMASLGSSSMTAGGVAYWAHVGGFVFGVGAALTMKHFEVEERFIRPKLDAVINPALVDNAVIDQALEARAAGEADAAFTLLAAAAHQQPYNPDVVMALGTVARDTHRQAEAGPAVVRLIEDELRQGETQAAIGHWRGLVRDHPDVRAASMLLLRLARVLSESGHRDEAAAALRLALLDEQGNMTVHTALRIAREAESVDSHVAQGAARIALAMPGINEVERSRAEALLAAAAVKSRSFL